MPAFGSRSRSRLGTCHADLRRVFEAVVADFDCTILTGHRNEEAQNRAVAEGRSQLRWPNGNHNRMPSIAVDVAPWPIDWEDRERFMHFAGYVRGVARGMGITLRWGGDWDKDFDLRDNTFDDLVHFELVEAPPGEDQPAPDDGA